MYFKRKLDNGIRVIAQKIPHFRSVTVGVWFGVGSIKETPEENGISHYIEHILFKGTEKRSAKDIASEMDAIGGQLNAFTSKQCTCYYAKVLDEHIEKAMDVLSDLVLHATLDQKELNKEKGVILEEISMVEDSPEDLVHDMLSQIYYDGHPLSKTILGPAENIRRFTRDDVIAYMNRYYTSDNIVIAVAGNFEEERLFALIQQYFSDMRQGEAVSFDFPEYRETGFNCAYKQKDTEQSHVCLGMPGYGMDDERNYYLNVLNNVFGGSMSSRLFQSIREERGLAYSIYSYPSPYSDTGMFGIYLGTNPANCEEAAKVILEQIHLLKEKGITPEEFEQGKEQLKASYILGQENTASRMVSLGKSMTLLRHAYSEREMIERIDRITLEDVNSIIPEVFQPEKLSVAMIGKKDETKQFRME